MASEKALRTRQAIIAAARDIIQEEGLGALTMDRAAEKAGVSKGACMYHFKTKRELQAALLQDYADHLDAELRRHEALFVGTPDETFVPGYIEWFRSFDRDNTGWARVGVALLSSFAHDAELIRPVRDWYRRLYARIEALPEATRVQTLVAVMALEGFFYTHKFGMDLAGADAKDEVWHYIKHDLVPVRAKRKPPEG